MIEQITQSLAGRVGIFSLLPFSASELQKGGFLAEHVDETLYQGGYPPIFDQDIDPYWWLDSYITTYVERDVRQIVNIQDAAGFRRFLSLCAGNIGQLFNASRLGNDCGVSHSTIEKWVSLLETSYIAFRLSPHHRNYRKRVVKTPKLYFWDVGLAIRLLGIESAQQLATYPLRGELFENWVVVELHKGRFNRGKRSNLFFWRNNTGLEVDVIAEQADRLLPIEIKSGATLTADWFKSMTRWLALAGDGASDPTLVYGGDAQWKEGTTTVVPWKQIVGLAYKV